MRFMFSIAVLVLISWPGPSQVGAQEVQNTIRDYFSGPITYSPADPWTRGKVFNAHTGNYGYFYNCDGEECKRNSPYICWKTHYENDVPQRRGLWNGLKIDLAKVRQRIADGSCECQPTECQCAKCTQAYGVVQAESNVPPSSSAELIRTRRSIAASPRETRSVVAAPAADHPVRQAQVSANRPATVQRYGLLSGVTIPTTEQPKLVQSEGVSQTASSYFLDRVHATGSVAGNESSLKPQQVAAKIKPGQATRVADQSGLLDRTRIIQLR